MKEDKSPIQRLIGLAKHTYHKGYGLPIRAQAQYDTLKSYKTLQPCGHEGRFIVQARGGTSFCAMCALIENENFSSLIIESWNTKEEDEAWKYLEKQG
jgi:hypothetical protein